MGVDNTEIDCKDGSAWVINADKATLENLVLVLRNKGLKLTPSPQPRSYFAEATQEQVKEVLDKLKIEITGMASKAIAVPSLGATESPAMQK